MMSDDRIVRRSLALFGAVALSALLFVPATLHAQQGAVTGRVTASATGQPLTGVQVFLQGLDQGTITDEDGRYRLAGVPTGQHTLRIRALGYQNASRRVTVSAGQATTADFALEVSAVGLEDVVVTATGEQQMRAIGHSVGTISADSLVQEAPVRDFSELLAGRTSGVSVRFGTGTVGSGTAIRVRGASSLGMSNQPIVYVDGSRVNADPTNLTVGTGGQETGALNINPENIASIEVLKGASAATLYGTEAANGVIRIRTKDGTGIEGGTEWTFWAESGLQVEPNDYPANWQAISQDGSPCPLTSVAAGACTQTEMRTFNLLENEATTPFSTGERWQAGGSAGGQVEGVNYFASGEYEFSQGVYGDENELSRVSLRGNFGGQLRQDLNLNVSTGYESRDVTLPQNDNNLFGVITNGLLGRAEEDGYWVVNPQEIATIDTRQEAEQFTGSANLDWTPTDWLTAHATGGMDVTNNKDQQLYPVGGIQFGRLGLGARESNSILAQNYTAEGFLRADLSLTDDIQSRTTVGSQYFVELQRIVFADGEELVPGTNSIATAATTTAGEATTESRTLGLFAQQRFTWKDRVYLTGGLRVDDNSAFGTDFGRVYYPSANVSWVLSEEPWFETGDWLGELRVRGSFGQSGNQPGTTDAVRFFQGVAVTDPTGGNAIGVSFDGGNLGNEELKPERTTEFEGGFEASLVGGRVTLSGTYYYSKTSDVLVQRTVAPSLGVTEERFVNLAKVRNQGIEGQVSALVLNQEDLRFNLDVSGSYNDNDLLELGEGISPIQVEEITEHREGYPLAGYWDQPLSWEDQNGDGIISGSEITVGDSLVFLGDPNPPVDINTSTSLTLFELLSLRSQWVANLGHALHNETESFRCGVGNSRFRHDPDSPLQRQANCVGNAIGATEAGFVQEADFLKLRELSATFRAPRVWARDVLGVQSLSLTVSGRNLATWTGFNGLDPEINKTGGSNFITGTFFTQPPLRYFNARVNVSF